jgi:hypothetical protein
MYAQGEPVHGELHSTDAHAGVQIPIYNEGSTTARTLGGDEYLEIHEISVFSAPGGDTIVAFAATNPGASPAAGAVVVRGTLAATGSIQLAHVHCVGLLAALPWLTTPAGAADCIFKGTVRSGTASSARPKWMESTTPGV